MASDPWYAEMARDYRERITEEVRQAPPSGPPPGGCAECWDWQFDDVDDDGTDVWRWFKVCSWECRHTHHEGEFWADAVVDFWCGDAV